MEKLQITMVHSPIRRNGKQRLIAQALGLKKIRQTVIHEDQPNIRGMVNKISHLLKVEKVQTDE